MPESGDGDIIIVLATGTATFFVFGTTPASYRGSEGSVAGSENPFPRGPTATWLDLL